MTNSHGQTRKKMEQIKGVLDEHRHCMQVEELGKTEETDEIIAHISKDFRDMLAEIDARILAIEAELARLLLACRQSSLEMQTK